MIDLQLLKDVDDIDHLTLEKQEDDAHQEIKHFTIRRIAPEKFSVSKAQKLLHHLELWYPETKDVVQKTDFSDTESLFNSLRAAREIILNK